MVDAQFSSLIFWQNINKNLKSKKNINVKSFNI